MMEVRRENRCEEGAALFQSGNLSDISIVCDDTSWSVHKAILVMHSSEFSKSITKKTTILDVTDFGFSSCVTGKLLEALYTCSYPLDNFESRPDGLRFHVTCFAAGVAHGVMRMQDAALNKIMKILSDRSIIKKTDLSLFLKDVYNIDYLLSGKLRRTVATRVHEDVKDLKTQDWFPEILQYLQGFAKDMLLIQLDSAATIQAQLRADVFRQFEDGQKKGRREEREEIEGNICDDHKCEMQECDACGYFF